MNKNLVKQFNFWRILGIVALVCTLLLTVVLCAESLKPGDKSEATSGSVSTSIKDNSTVHDNDRTYPLTAIISHQSSASAAVGVKKKLTFTYTPKRATDKRLTFSSDNPDIVSVDENGVLSFNSVGRALITAKSQVDPSVSTTFPVYCDGVKVDDVSEIELSFVGEKLDDYIPIPEGTRYVSFVDKDEETIYKQAYKIVSSKPEVLHVDTYNNIVAVSPGIVTLTITNKDTNQSKDFQIKVTENSAFVDRKSIYSNPKVSQSIKMIPLIFLIISRVFFRMMQSLTIDFAGFLVAIIHCSHQVTTNTPQSKWGKRRSR